MKQVGYVLGCMALAAGLASPALAQRRTVEGPKVASGAAAKVLYKQDFNEEGVVDNFDGGQWHESGAYGSKGCLKVPAGSTEHYLKWINEGTTICFMYYLHGINEAYFQAFSEPMELPLPPGIRPIRPVAPAGRL